MTYKYICNDPLSKKINYEYSPYQGQLFIDQWRNYRDEFMLNNQADSLGVDSEYKSQLQSDNQPRSIEGLRSLASYRGVNVGVKYAEAYNIVYRKI